MLASRKSRKSNHSRLNPVADLDLDILHIVLLEGLARDAGVLLAQFQADDLAVFAHGVRPVQAREADIHTDLEDLLRQFPRLVCQ